MGAFRPWPLPLDSTYHKVGLGTRSQILLGHVLGADDFNHPATHLLHRWRAAQNLRRLWRSFLSEQGRNHSVDSAHFGALSALICLVVHEPSNDKNLHPACASELQFRDTRTLHQ